MRTCDARQTLPSKELVVLIGDVGAGHSALNCCCGRYRYMSSLWAVVEAECAPGYTTYSMHQIPFFIEVF